MNGYTTLELGGKKRGIKFGNRALLDFGAKHNIMNGEPLVFSYEVIVDLVYFGLLNNCMVKRETPDFDHDDVQIWVDEAPLEKLMQVFGTFTDSYSAEEKPKGKASKN